MEVGSKVCCVCIKLAQIVHAADHVSVESDVGQGQQSMTELQVKA